MTPRRWSSRAALCVALTLAATAAGCKGDDPVPAETTATTGTSAPATTAPAVSPESQRLLDDPDAVIPPPAKALLQPEELEVARAYVRAEQAWIRAGMAPVDPNHPDLAATTGGEVLESVRDTTRKLAQERRAYQAPKVLTVLPKRFDMDSAGAGVLVCLTRNVPVYDTQTGAVVDEDLYSFDSSADFEQRDGRWVLVRLERVGDFRDGSSCS